MPAELGAILVHFCTPRVPSSMAHLGPDHAFCEEVLSHVSRSFGMVIQQLPPRLRLSVTVFYLVLRGLDTVRGVPPRSAP